MIAGAEETREQIELAQMTKARSDPALERMVVLRLAVGMPVDETRGPSWDTLLRVAVSERCAMLAWLRSSSTISRLAPPSVAQRWRTIALGSAAGGSALWGASVRAVRALDAAGIEAVVLKGAPLSWRLYGDTAARVSTDIDLFVSRTGRTKAHAALLADGWEPLEGTVSGDEEFALREGNDCWLLEVHSTLFHPRFSYLRVPGPQSRAVIVDGVPIRMFDGPLLPGYLATHLCMHQLAPFLWWLDLHELWHSLSENERQAAHSRATSADLGRYLEWALVRVAALDALMNGDLGAARELGVREGSRLEAHPMWRHVALAPSLASSIRAAGGWIWPYWMREEYGRGPQALLRRLRRNARSLLPQRQRLR